MGGQNAHTASSKSWTTRSEIFIVFQRKRTFWTLIINFLAKKQEYNAGEMLTDILLLLSASRSKKIIFIHRCM